MNDPLALAARAHDHVNPERLLAAIAKLASFGGRADGGVSRQALSEVDLQARAWLAEQARLLGCELAIDDCANLYFRRAGSEDLPPVMSGSHVDTQPVGGKYDGAYGVVAAMEVLAALNDAGIQTRRPVEVVVWNNEEGSRFSPGTMGSSAYVDPSRLAGFREVRDGDGVRFADALDRALAQAVGHARKPMAAPVSAFIELHIEQGPVLEQAGTPLGVVTGIQGVSWYRVKVLGQMAHAGTTPMQTRDDAMATAVGLAQKLYDYAEAMQQSALKLTLGRWLVEPNSINTIPGSVEFTIDVRCPDPAVLEQFDVFLSATLEQHKKRGALTHERFFSRAPTAFPTEMQQVVERAAVHACRTSGNAAPIALTSGAFHDAMYMADHCPTGMIFVPSEAGISHNAAEETKPADLVLGARALAHAVTELACR